MKLNYFYSSILTIAILGNYSLPALAQIPGYSNNSEILISRSDNIPGVVIDIGGKGYQGFYGNNGRRIRNSEFPEHDKLSGSAIMGKKDIENIGRNQWFSVITLQDGFVRLAILQKGKKLNINYLGNYYRFQKLIKVGERRYILNSENDPNEGGDDYYDVDLRNINKPSIKKIDLATAQTLGRTKKVEVFPTQQPTNTEIKKLNQELQEHIRLTKNNSTGVTHLQDRRTPAEKSSQQSFVRAWLTTEPKLAPFFGLWGGYPMTKHIYPSNSKGRVCIISTSGGYGKVDTGNLSNGVILTSKGEVLFKNGNYLGVGLLKNGEFVSNNGDIPLKNPRPLEPLNKLLDYIAEKPDKSQISQQFKTAGCIFTIPSSSRNK